MAIFTPRRSYYRRARWNRRSTVATRARGNYRAALAQKDSGEFVMNVIFSASISNTHPVFAINIYDVLLHSEMYSHFAPMYDQVKINRVRFKLSPVSMPYNRNITLVTAWDRNGLDAAQISDATLTNTRFANEAASGVDINPYNYENLTADTSTYCTLSAAAVSSYSSAVTKSIVPGSACTIVRYLAPSSMAEKSEYVAVHNILEWWDSKASPGDYTVKAVTSGSSTADKAAQKELILAHVPKNLAYLQSADSVAWKPTLLIGALDGIFTHHPYVDGTGEEEEVADDILETMSFMIEFDINVTFRGLRKSSVV